MACRFMGCSLIKKAVLGTALGAGALYLVFGTSAPSYVKTAFHKVRDNAKSAVPVQFEIDRAKQEIADLEPAIKEGIAQRAQAEVEIESMMREIAAIKAELKQEEMVMDAERTSLRTGEFRLAGSATYTPEEIKADLARRLDHLRLNKRLVADKEATLGAKQKALEGAKKQLNQMADAKKTLRSKIEGIEARLQAIRTAEDSREFHFDDSALARAKQTVFDLEKRLDVMTRQSDMEAKYLETGIPVTVEPGRDILHEVDTELGAPATRKPGDKSL
jgi:chromosome segregation ATPase